MNTHTDIIEVLPPEGKSQPLALTIPEGLEPATSHSLREAFEAYFRQADEWRAKALAIQITRPDQSREMQLARTTRLALREIRINADKTRKALKEDSLRKGKAIDGIYNMLAFAVEPLEKHLMEQEQFVERMEHERKARLKAEREEQLALFGVNVSLYQLGEMDAATFANLLETNQLAFTARQEAARKAEAERIEREAREAEERAKREAEAVAERQRLQAENERLQAEKAEAEAKARAERQAAELAAREAAAKAQAEREAAEKARREAEAKARQEREAAEAQARAEREAREKAEAELRAKQEAERKAKEAAEAKARAAAQAPDREKLAAFAEAVRNLPIPTLENEAGKAITNLIREQVTKFAAWVINQQTKLN
jgi:hypothetical protein